MVERPHVPPFRLPIFSSSTPDMNNEPLRVIIRTCVTDIPGEPTERVYHLGGHFCQQILRRPLNINLQTTCYDAMHFLPNFDSKNAVRAWFIYDFNVTGPLTREEVCTITHEVYHASRQDNSWSVEREN